MLVRFLGFVLLAALPGALHAQDRAPSCTPPVLGGGYFVPKQNKYPPQATLTYSCDAGRKPVVEGWWATVKCQSGKWSPEPQCIDEKSCIPPNIPNRQYDESEGSWYEDKQRIKVRCQGGYELKPSSSTITCRNGRWSSLPVCEKRPTACDMPPKIPNAVIVSQEPKEVFASNTQLKYECEEGYDTGAEDARNIIKCSAGRWIKGPSCSQYCIMEPATYEDKMSLPSTTYVKEGETKRFPCQWRDYSLFARCTNRRLFTTDCCHDSYINDPYYCRFSERT